MTSASATVSDGSDGRIVFSGALDFDTVPEVLPQTVVAIDTAAGHATAAGHDASSGAAAGAQLVFDLAGVERANSAALALLVEALACCRKQGINCRFEHLPEAVTRLADVCDAGWLLEPGSADAAKPAPAGAHSQA